MHSKAEDEVSFDVVESRFSESICYDELLATKLEAYLSFVRRSPNGFRVIIVFIAQNALKVNLICIPVTAASHKM